MRNEDEEEAGDKEDGSEATMAKVPVKEAATETLRRVPDESRELGVSYMHLAIV